MLIDFPNEVGAVMCALEVQRALEALRVLAPNAPMHMRIGLHSGESLVRCGRLYGDPVNIAARLQTAAEPDAVYMSEAVAERMPSPVQHRLDELGARPYKNVPQQIRTTERYRNSPKRGTGSLAAPPRGLSARRGRGVAG